MTTGTKKQAGQGRARTSVLQPKRKRSPSKRTRTTAAAKMVIDRRRVLAFGMAAVAATIVPVEAFAQRTVIASSGAAFMTEAKRAIALFDEWRRIGDELKEVDAALKTMSREDSCRSHYLVRVNDLPIERFRAALIADQALRDTMRMKTSDRKEAAVQDTLLLSLMVMTGKEPQSLKRELGLAT